MIFLATIMLAVLAMDASAGERTTRTVTPERHVVCTPERRDDCRRPERPFEGHRSAVDGRVYRPFERDPVEVRERRPFE